MSASSQPKASDVLKSEIESFSITSPWLKQTSELRMDASFYNPRVAEALAVLRRSGLKLKPLRDVTDRIFIPNRFKRIYVKKEHGLPFLQGSHVVHFQPADMKYVSKTAHKNIDLWIIREGWILVTRSGTVGRVAVTSPMWNGWAASEHILRIVPDPKSDCPPGYICAFLSSELGQAQLTSQIYGAVVDEITEDQARSVLIPVPTTDAQRAAVKKIDALAMESMRAKDEAVRAAQNSVSEITSLLSHQAGQAPGASEAAAQENRKRIATVSPDRLSMHPVDAKDALRAFMQVDPKKVKAAEAKTRADKPTRR